MEANQDQGLAPVVENSLFDLFVSRQLFSFSSVVCRQGSNRDMGGPPPPPRDPWRNICPWCARTKRSLQWLFLWAAVWGET